MPARKPFARRTRAGRVARSPARVAPTPQMAARRAAAGGIGETDNPIDVLAARGAITLAEAEAGARYERRTRAIYGAARYRGSLIAESVDAAAWTPPLTEDEAAEIAREVRGARDALRAAGQSAARAVEDVVIRRLPPGRTAEPLRAGLRALARYFARPRLDETIEPRDNDAQRVGSRSARRHQAHQKSGAPIDRSKRTVRVYDVYNTSDEAKRAQLANTKGCEQ